MRTRNVITEICLCFCLLIAEIITTGAHAAETSPAPDALGPVPTEGQMAWHKAEMIALLCFGLNTYTDQEWGYGDVSPEIFNPTELDTDQWVSACKAGGINGIILVAKHHDGFCLWPSGHTEYSVKATPWRSSKGDILGDLARSCEKHDLMLGVYLSPWDRNHAEYARPAYVEYFFNQWQEVMTDYGSLFEIWFDGANGGTGYYGGAREKRSIGPNYYRFSDLMELRDTLQPNAVAFGARRVNSTRWVGNESGVAKETNWCRHDPGGDRGTGAENGTMWMPAESDTPLRGGWYWHEKEDPKSLDHLVETYFATVGRNSTLNFGVAPDRRGLLEEEDVARLRELGDYVRRMQTTDFAHGRKVASAQTRGRAARFAAANVTDGCYDSYWATNDGVLRGDVVIDLGGPVTFNVVEMQEYVPLGQRVKAWSVEVPVNGQWHEIGRGTTIGYKRLLRIPTTTASKARVRILDALACPTLNNVSLYRTPVLMRDPVIVRGPDGMVSIDTPEGATGFYAVGNNPLEKAFKEYREPFALKEGGRVHAYVMDTDTGRKTRPITVTFGIAKAKWRIAGCSFPNRAGAPVERLIDGDAESMWHTHGPEEGRVAPPQWVAIDLGARVSVTGFTCMPRHDGCAVGLVDQYAFFVSEDGSDWGDPVARGEFSNIHNNPVLQTVILDRPIVTRFIKFMAERALDNNDCVAICELGIMAELSN